VCSPTCLLRHLETLGDRRMSNKGTNLVTVDTDEYRDMLKKVYTHDSGVMEIKAQAEYEGSKKVARNLKTALHNQCGEAVDELEELLHAVKFRIPEEAKTSTRDLLIEIGTEKKSYHTEAADLVHEFETKLHRFDGNADKIKEVIELEKETLYDFERRHHASLEDIGKRFVNRGAHHLSQIFLSYWKDHDRVRLLAARAPACCVLVRRSTDRLTAPLLLRRYAPRYITPWST
jgi:hypothetical protein